MLTRYNEIYRKCLPKITPHVCRHTYCSIQAKSGMNPKTLQYLMGCGCPGDTSAEGRSTDRADRRDHSDIGVTLNVYTHLGFDDAAEEMERIQKAEEIREEIEPKEEVTQNIFRVV